MHSVTPNFSEEECHCIKKEAPKAEQLGHLTDKMIQLAAGKKLFHLFVPKKYGGFQLDLPTALRVIENAARLDGSFGWVLTLGSGAGLFGAYMEPQLAKEIFSTRYAFISGSGYPGGTAEEFTDFYKINGYWKYASGIDNATCITANCHITRNGQYLKSDGKPVIKAFVLYPDNISYTKNWNSYGLKGTGSHDFRVDDITIPKSRTFSIASEASFINDPLYHFPFEPFAQCTLGSALLGMVKHFLYEARRIILKKYNVREIYELPQLISKKLEDSFNIFESARNELQQSVKSAWTASVKKEKSAEALADHMGKVTRKSCSKILRSTQNIYPFLGMTAIRPETTINRTWRDIHTASQHILLQPKD